MKLYFKIVLSAALALFPAAGLLAESKVEESKEFKITYKQNDPTVYPDYATNTAEMKSISNFLNGVKDTTSLVIDIISYSSPEGEGKRNVELSELRAKTAEDFLRMLLASKGFDLSKIKISSSNVAENWAGLRKFVSESDNALKYNVLATLDNSDLSTNAKKAKLKKYNEDGFIDEIYLTLRSAHISISHSYIPEPVAAKAVSAPVIIFQEPAPKKRDPNNDGWSIYVNGGIGSFMGYRYKDDILVNHNLNLDLNIGFNYNIRPWARVGMNLGYANPVISDNYLPSTITNPDKYTKLSSTDLENSIYQNIALAAGMVEFNPIGSASSFFGMWMGIGCGYSCVYSVYKHTHADVTEITKAGKTTKTDEIVTDPLTKSTVHSLYVPVTLSFEFYVSNHVALTLGGHYNCFPLKDRATVSKGLWGADFGIRYTFFKKNIK